MDIAIRRPEGAFVRGELAPRSYRRRPRVEFLAFFGGVMKTHKIAALNGGIAVHESSAGQGPPVVLIHGNSSSSSVFSRQLDGALGERFRLIAVDLPGHGASG